MHQLAVEPINVCIWEILISKVLFHCSTLALTLKRFQHPKKSSHSIFIYNYNTCGTEPYFFNVDLYLLMHSPLLCIITFLFNLIFYIHTLISRIRTAVLYNCGISLQTAQRTDKLPFTFYTKLKLCGFCTLSKMNACLVWILNNLDLLHIHAGMKFISSGIILTLLDMWR